MPLWAFFLSRPTGGVINIITGAPGPVGRPGMRGMKGADGATGRGGRVRTKNWFYEKELGCKLLLNFYRANRDYNNVGRQ